MLLNVQHASNHQLNVHNVTQDTTFTLTHAFSHALLVHILHQHFKHVNLVFHHVRPVQMPTVVKHASTDIYFTENIREINVFKGRHALITII